MDPLAEVLLRERFPGSAGRIMLCERTTWRIGGPALSITVGSVPMLSDLLGLTAEEGIGTFVLGKGSNILASDEGCDRVIIVLGGDLTRADWKSDDDRWILSCGAGRRLPSLAGAACTRGASGMDFAVGIPGTIGGAIFMNAGAYGGSISDDLTAVRCVGPSGEERVMRPSECGFGYRSSVFQGGSLVITGAEFLLRGGDPAALRERARSVLALRRDTLPLDLPSAGSVFRKPSGEIAPGKVIEESGLKGRMVGGAMVSRIHANFIVNTGGASSSDVSDLIETVKDEVHSRTGILLAEEIRYLGRED